MTHARALRAAAAVAAVLLLAACGGGSKEPAPRGAAPTWVPAAAPGTIVTVVGAADLPLRGPLGRPREVRLTIPVDVAFDGDGNFYIAERYNHRILKVDVSGEVSVVAGRVDETGWAENGFAGDGGPASDALLNQASTVAAAPDGTLYIGDAGNSRIRKVDPGGIITTVAGTGERGFSGDGGPATQAAIDNPLGLLVAPDGSLYFVDAGNHRIRKIDAGGKITTVAGSGEPGYLTEAFFSPDGTPAGEARIGDPSDHMPTGLAFDADGNLLYTDMGLRRIRMIDGEGHVATVAGNGELGYPGDGFEALDVGINDPLDVAVAADGTLYVSTHTHGPTGNLVLAVATDGRVTVLAGGKTGYEGDGGPAADAGVNIPAGLAIGPGGNLYVADANNNVIRMIALP